MLNRVSGLYGGLFVIVEAAVVAGVMAAPLGWVGVVLGAAPLILFGFLEVRLRRPLRALEREIHRISGEAVRPNGPVSKELGPIFSAIHAMGEELLARNRELRRQKEEFRRLFDLVPCIITVQDRDFRLVEYNSEFREGFAPGEGDFCYHAYKGRTSPCPHCPVAKTFQDGEPHSSYEMGVKKDGSSSYWFVKTFPIRDETGEITAAMEVCHDITPVRLLVEELQHTENRYFAIFNTLTTPVFVVDPEKKVITECNSGAESLYGYEHDDLCGSPFSRLFADPNDSELPICARNACCIERLRHVNRKGEILWVSMGVASMEESDRSLMLITFSDITRIVQAEEQMIHAGKMATLGTMATGVAHELNQPLTVLKSSIGLLKRRQKRGDPVGGAMLDDLLSEMDTYVDRASQIINDMREFGRKDEAKLESVSVPGVVEMAVRMFKEQFRLREVSLAVTSDPGLPCIMAEPHRLEQVVVNLLINARDSVCKRWEDGQRGDPKEVAVVMNHRNGRVEIDISDNGVGMEERTRRQIFDPFFTTKGPGEGTGIGLSISDNIVRSFGGTIHVWSKPGKGSRFTVSFPAAPPRGEAGAPGGR